jgi:beta-propeller uncharacterized protein DUF5122
MKLIDSGATFSQGASEPSLMAMPTGSSSYVRVVVVQPDGKILIGGDFTTLSPDGGVAVTRNHIARLNADGTLDTAFDANFRHNGMASYNSRLIISAGLLSSTA